MKKTKAYAEGTPDEPAAADDEAPETPDQEEETPEEPSPDDTAEPTLAPPEPQSQGVTPDSLPPKPDVMPQAGFIDVQGQKPAPPPAPAAPPTPQQMAADLTAHDMDFQRDLAMGHVQPETYQSLYAKKDTLGKIGTLFGLLVGGAGAGLTHQPNAVMQMMDKQIQNDFEAQKQTQDNARNWRNLAQQHAIQKAQIGLMGAQTGQAEAGSQNTQAETLKTLTMLPQEQESLKAKTAEAKANAQLIGSNTALNMMRLSMIHNLQSTVIDPMPPGAIRDQAQATLNNLSNTVNAKNTADNLQTTQQIDARNKLLAAKNPALNRTGIDENRFNQALANSRAAAASGVPGDNEGELNKERALITTNRSLMNNWMDSFKFLDNKALAGNLNPANRNAAVSHLAARIVALAGGSRSMDETKALVNSFFPAATDVGDTRETKLKEGIKFFQQLESGTPIADRLHLKTPFPTVKASRTAKETKQSSGTKDGAMAKNAKGESFIYRGGKWHRETSSQATK